MDKTKVILVNSNDIQTGTMEKMEAHQMGLLHRAVSVFILNSKGEWLLQQRAAEKYHSPGLWTNTCCTHPYPGESNEDAANRRLMEEMGVQAKLKKIFDFTYNEKLSNQLIENEFDHVFIGITDSTPSPDKSEVMAIKYIDFSTLEQNMNIYPEKYTVWFKKIAKRVMKIIETEKSFGL